MFLLKRGQVDMSRPRDTEAFRSMPKAATRWFGFAVCQKENKVSGIFHALAEMFCLVVNISQNLNWRQTSTLRP